MWKNSREIMKAVGKILPVSSVYVLGSFTTKKNRPADVDFIILLRTKKGAGKKWSADLVIAPDNEYGKTVLEDASKWMRQKYGAKKSMLISQAARNPPLLSGE